MEPLFLLVLAGLTSLGAYLVGTHWLGLSRRDLRIAVGKMLECAGMTLLFFIINLGGGVIAILAVRTLTGTFLTLYLLNDVALLGLSLLQALALEWWRGFSAPRHGRRSVHVCSPREGTRRR